MKSTRLTLALALAAAAAFAACDSERSEERTTRCATCGMVVSDDSGWRAGGDDLAFDAPKCLHRHRHREGDVPGAWVIEYYSQERRPAREVLYVLSSDLESPMGRDLVPVAGRDAAERLMTDHHGERILTFDEVTEPIVDELFRPRP